jgi:hypothetical protein
LFEQLDKQIIVCLRDGRNFLGRLGSSCARFEPDRAAQIPEQQIHACGLSSLYFGFSRSPWLTEVRDFYCVQFLFTNC